MNSAKLQLFADVFNKKEKITFVHTPKTAGTSLKNSKNFGDYIKYKGHVQASKTDSASFTIIRHPIQRFESFLNYRLQEKTPRPDFKPHLHFAYSDKSICLDEVVEKITNDDITNFTPFKFLTYWTQNVHLCLMINQLNLFFQKLEIPITLPPKEHNKSEKTRGTFSEKSIQKITQWYRRDIELFNRLIREES